MVTTRRASKAKAQVDSMGLFRVLADAEIGVIADLLPQDAAGRLESTCSGLLRVVRSQRSRLVLPSVAASVKGLERCDVVDGWLAALERYPLASYVDGRSVRDDVFDILLVGLGAALSAGRFKVLARVGAPPECSDILRYQLEQSFQIETEPSLSDGMRRKGVRLQRDGAGVGSSSWRAASLSPTCGSAGAHGKRTRPALPPL